MGNPTIVFSLGAWVIPEVFDSVRDNLRTIRYTSECLAHPSMGAEPSSKPLEDDINAFSTLLINLTDEEKNIIVIAHSYGGVVASSAVDGLSVKARQKLGKRGGVVKFIYLVAFALDKGQSLLGMLGGQFLPWMEVEGDYVWASSAMGWQDLSGEEQEKWNPTVVHASKAVFEGEALYEPWHDITCAYIMYENDLALPLPFQKLFAGKVAGPKNTYSLPRSHSPFLSMPDTGRTVDVIQMIIVA